MHPGAYSLRQLVDMARGRDVFNKGFVGLLIATMCNQNPFRSAHAQAVQVTDVFPEILNG